MGLYSFFFSPFCPGFTGCVGALRENTTLLAAYAIFLAILLLLEMTCGILGFIFKDWIKSQATSGFQAFIVHYRDDPDQQNLIDWIQEGWLQCCGIEGPTVRGGRIGWIIGGLM